MISSPICPRSGSGSRTATLGTTQSECRPLASLDTAPPTVPACFTLLSCQLP